MNTLHPVNIVSPIFVNVSLKTERRLNIITTTVPPIPPKLQFLKKPLIGSRVSPKTVKTSLIDRPISVIS